jgi:hypothetical protein
VRDDSDGETAPRLRAAELLLGYLEAAGAPPWPGADWLTVDVVLRAYAQVAVRSVVRPLVCPPSGHPLLLPQRGGQAEEGRRLRQVFQPMVTR